MFICISSVVDRSGSAEPLRSGDCPDGGDVRSHQTHSVGTLIGLTVTVTVSGAPASLQTADVDMLMGRAGTTGGLQIQRVKERLSTQTADGGQKATLEVRRSARADKYGPRTRDRQQLDKSAVSSAVMPSDVAFVPN